VDALIGPETVCTVPGETLRAFLAVGQPRLTLTEDVVAARATLATLEQLGIDLTEIADELVAKGVSLFSDSFDKLLATLGNRCHDLVGGGLAGRPVLP
jgi:transaldolase